MNIYYLCLTQQSNMGDLVINRMLIQELGKYGTVYVDCYGVSKNFKHYILNSQNTIDVYKEYGISLKKAKLIKFADFTKRFDIRLFVQSPGPIAEPDSFLTKMYLRLVYKWVKMNHIPFYRIGSCCSAIMARKNKLHNCNVSYYFLRAKNTVEYMKSLGYNNVNYIPDLAYLLPTENLTDKKKIAVINFREIKTDLSTFMSWIKEVVGLLILNGYTVELYYQVQKDKIFMQAIYDNLSEYNVIFRDNILWFNNIDYYADKELVISNRLHSVLVGASYGVIPIAYIDTDALIAKIKDIFLSSFYGKHSDYITTNRSLDVIKKALKNKEKYQMQVSYIFRKNKLLCQNIIKSIIENINNEGINS